MSSAPRPGSTRQATTCIATVSRTEPKFSNAYRPNSRSTSQPSSPAAACGRAEVRVGPGRFAPAEATGESAPGEGAAGAEGGLTCDAACIRFEKPLYCEFGNAATGTP